MKNMKKIQLLLLIMCCFGSTLIMGETIVNKSCDSAREIDLQGDFPAPSSTYQYKKSIQIPTGATLIIPDDATMAKMSPMGAKPGTSTIGYTSQLVSIGSIQDTYYLVTEGREITYNNLGQQVASADNPI